MRRRRRITGPPSCPLIATLLRMSRREVRRFGRRARKAAKAGRCDRAVNSLLAMSSAIGRHSVTASMAYGCGIKTPWVRALERYEGRVSRDVTQACTRDRR